MHAPRSLRNCCGNILPAWTVACSLPEALLLEAQEAVPALHQFRAGPQGPNAALQPPGSDDLVDLPTPSLKVLALSKRATGTDQRLLRNSTQCCKGHLSCLSPCQVCQVTESGMLSCFSQTQRCRTGRACGSTGITGLRRLPCFLKPECPRSKMHIRSLSVALVGSPFGVTPAQLLG